MTQTSLKTMTRNLSDRIFDSQTCLCCMCRCGDHKCFQQLALKLPIWMQNELKIDRDKTCGIKKTVCKAEPFPKTTYKKDFCERQDIVDRYPVEQMKLAENLKPFSRYGYKTNDSIYRDDFIPWSLSEQELYRGKLHIPGHILNTKADRASGDVLEPFKEDQFYSYYCPPHCLGDEKPQLLENCLIGQKDRFNLGPPAKRTSNASEKSDQPFAKFSNYMLDYRSGKISPKNKAATKGLVITKSPCPMSSETSYRGAFTCPPEMDRREPKKKEAQADTLTVGEGPMIQQTTSMLDYKDPDVAVHKPVRPPRDVLQPPPCRMETTTTTGRAFPSWRGRFRQEKLNKEKYHEAMKQGTESDVRHFVTTYQEDFDGLNSALCLCRVVEKYGPKVLEPQYSYTESEKLHDIFQFNKGNSKLRNIECHH